jgi:hypothetical protein
MKNHVIYILIKFLDKTSSSQDGPYSNNEILYNLM